MERVRGRAEGEYDRKLDSLPLEKSKCHGVRDTKASCHFSACALARPAPPPPYTQEVHLSQYAYQILSSEVNHRRVIKFGFVSISSILILRFWFEVTLQGDDFVLLGVGCFNSDEIWIRPMCQPSGWHIGRGPCRCQDLLGFTRNMSM